MNSLLKKTFLSLSFLFLPLVFVNQVLAFDNYQRYYDWGPSQIRVNPKILGVSVYAQQSSSPSATAGRISSYDKFNYFLGFAAGVPADSPLYFLKTFQENAALALTFDPQKREVVRLAIAGRRLEELEDLSQEKKDEAVARVAEAYRQNLENVVNHLGEIKSQTPQNTEAIKNMEEETTRHSLVLNSVLVRVPEKAQAALETAISASEKVTDTAADLSGRTPLPTEVLDRLHALKQQGLLSTEEVGILTAVKSRVEARELLKKYANEGVFPKADLQKFDDVAREKFGDDYKRIIEIKKFLELKGLEEEKPDEETIKKVQDFAKTYKSGESVPTDIRRYWVPLVRLEELQNTIRPDLIDEKVFQGQKGNYDKFQELVRRVQPRAEDLATVENIISKNPNAALDPFYERVRRLAEKYGTTEGGYQVPGMSVEAKSCPTNAHWAAVPYMPEGGYCVPNITYTAYQGPVQETVSGEKKTVGQPESICPSKYHRNYPGGPCVPDTYFGPSVGYPTYTPGSFPSPVFGPVSCPGGYFWSGTTCLDSSRACGGGVHWDAGTKTCVVDSRTFLNQCRTGEYSGPKGVCTSYEKSEDASKCFSANKFWTGRECLDKAPEGGGGVACPQGQVWDDKNKVCSTGGYGGVPNPPNYQGGQPVTPSRESQEAACRAGGGTCVSWNNGACGCERSGQSSGGGYSGSCPAGQNWVPEPTNPRGGYCANNSSSTSGYSGGGYTPSRESQEAACRSGGGTCVSWVNGACGCERPGQSGGYSSSCSAGQNWVPEPTNPRGGYCANNSNPPSGYGSCSSGQYWNGSSCQSSNYTPPPSAESPEQACLRGGCTWSGSSCNCPASSPTPTTTTTSPTPSPSLEPVPTPPPPLSPSPEPTPGSACSSGQYWNGSACVQGQ